MNQPLPLQSAKPPSSTGKVTVVGSINVDQTVRVQRLPSPGETLLGSSITIGPGGKGANQALAAARLGATVSLIGAVGDDASAAAATELLQSAGVDLSAVTSVAGPTGLALIYLADDAENTIVVVPGANAAMDASMVETSAAQIAGAAVVVLQGEIPVDGIAAAVRLCNGRVVLNLAPVVALDHSVIRTANPLVVNEHEAALVLSQLDAEADVRAEDEALVVALRAQGVPGVVLTRGAQGAICSDRAGTFSVPAPRVNAIDSSGAGDAFVGALSARLAIGETLLEASRYATRVGAFAVQSQGTQASYPHSDDVLPEAEQ